MIEAPTIRELAEKIVAEFDPKRVFAEVSVIDGQHYFGFMVWREGIEKEQIGRVVHPIGTSDELREGCDAAREVFNVRGLRVDFA